MVFTTSGEQKMDFRVHHTSWEPVDLDGIKLMRRPAAPDPETAQALKPGFSNAAKRQMLQRISSAASKRSGRYVIIDLETTGLDHSQDEIIEFGALLVENGQIIQEYSRLVRCSKALPQKIIDLTGITQDQLREEGVALPDALADFLEFIGHERMVGYHIAFDMGFLRAACLQCSMPIPTNQCVDLLSIARRKVRGVPNFKLATLADHFSLSASTQHRALADCELIQALYSKLNEK